MNSEEKVIARLVICLSGFFGLIPLFADFALKWEYYFYLKFAILVAAALVVFYGKEKILLLIINNIPAAKAGRSISDGTWMIQISFTEGNEVKVRTGNVKFQNSLIGVKVKGDKLFNPKTEKPTMNNWYAENAEIVAYDGGHELLYYLYKIPVDSSGKNGVSKYQKVGYVCAIKMPGEEVYKGSFHDIKVADGDGDRRAGTVILSKNKY